MAGRQHARGSGLQVVLGEQSDYDSPVLPDKLWKVTFPEEMARSFDFEFSGEPSANRDHTSITRNDAVPEGTMNYLMRTQSLGLIYKWALGGDVDVLTVPNANLSIRTQLWADYTTGSSVLQCRYIPDTFPKTGGRLAIIARTDGDMSKALYAATDIPYTSHDNLDFTLTAPLAAPIADDAKVEDFIVRYEDNLNEWADAQAHFYYGGQELSTLLSMGILMDKILKYYYDCKVETLAEEFPQTSGCTGSVEIKAGQEFWAAHIGSDVTAGDTVVDVEDRLDERRDLEVLLSGVGTKTIFIGTESLITCTGYDNVANQITGIPAVGDGSIAEAHSILPISEPIALSSIPSMTARALHPQLKWFNAGLVLHPHGMRSYPPETIKVLSASYEVANNLNTDKVFLGETKRAAILEGLRETTGECEFELDSPVEYDRALRDFLWTFEIRCTDVDRWLVAPSATINGVGVRYTNDTFFEAIQFVGETPTTPDDGPINFTMPWNALAGQRLPSIVKLVQNDQTDATQGAEV